MEISYLKALLDGISQFRFISSKTVAKPELVQKYCDEIDEILKRIKPVLDEIINHEIALAEQLIKMLEEVNAFVDEACGLVESWHQMMSKVYFVLQIESVVTKIQGSVLESCSLLSSLFQSLGVYSGLDCVQQCVQELQQLTSIQTSNIIREAMRDQMENKTPKPQHLVEITDSVCLSTNQELLMETVALDKLKMKYARGENHGEVEYIDHMIALITHLHECHVEKYQVHSINNIPIPADFCCPLSLDLMSDPVIVASGQTYERAFIKQWLDQGFTVCPKTRQTLGHTNLIPNYTVKALIENWCDTNNIKLPDPTKLMNLNHTSNLLAHADHSTDDSSGHLVGTSYPKSPESNRSTIHRNSVTSNGSHYEVHLNDRSHHDSVSVDSSSLDVDGAQAEISRLSLASSNSEEPHLEKQHGYSGGQTSVLSNDSSHTGKEQLEGHNRSASASSAVYGSNYLQGAGDENNDRTQNNSSGASGKVKLGAPSSLPRELEFPPRLGDSRSRSQTIWRRPSDRFSPRIVSPPSLETRPDLTGVETVVRKLIEDLKTDSIDGQRDATAELRLLAKHSMENRIVIANCGAIEILVDLLNSSDLKMQENAVTALLNLSINDNNKFAIANANCIEPLMHVLRFGNPEAKENAAATIFSLSVIEENKVKIGRSGAIGPLVDLLGNGTPRGKKDAATALFNLSIFHENKARIVQAGAVRHLVELMDPAAGMVDKAVAVLANLSTIPEGRSAIGHEGGIPVLVEVVELGTTRGKENAAAALLQLCTNSNKFCSMVLQEGAVPPLVALSQSGTSRAKEKAQALLSYFRNQRHGSVGRA